MKRNWNAWVWAGFGLTLVSAFSYVFFFIRFPITRDFPWLTLLLFIVAGWLLPVGLKRAYGQPEHYRGKVTGGILWGFSAGLMGGFCFRHFSFSTDKTPRLQALPPDAPLP